MTHPPSDPIELYRLDINTPINTFVCTGGVGYSNLQRFLLEDAVDLQTEHMARTVVAMASNNVAGYITYTIGSLVLYPEDAAGVEIAEYAGNEAPALVIHYLAVADGYRSKGIGSTLVNHVFQVAGELRAKVPCRLITVTAYADAVNFYEKLDFERACPKAQWLAVGKQVGEEDSPECVLMLANLGPEEN